MPTKKSNETPKFRVGDRVKIVANDPPLPASLKTGLLAGLVDDPIYGSTGTIAETVQYPCYGVRVDPEYTNGAGPDGLAGYFEHELELVERKEN